MQNGWYEKICEIQVVVKEGCDGKSVTKILIITIPVNFVPIPGMRQHKFT